MEEFDFELTPADLQLMSATEDSNKGVGLLWLLIILGVVVLGLVLYLHLSHTMPKREKLGPYEL
jgi:hypothetical protein